MNDEQKQKLALKFLSILGKPDAEVVKEVASEGVVWTFPGTSQISGEAHGIDAIMKRARTIASFKVKVEIVRTVYGFSGVSVFSTTPAKRTERLWTSISPQSSHSRATRLSGSTRIFPTSQWSKRSLADRSFVFGCVNRSLRRIKGNVGGHKPTLPDFDLLPGFETASTGDRVVALPVAAKLPVCLCNRMASLSWHSSLRIS
ncbi:MAG: hypothetical protein WDN50_08115 [Bradyrhizobium sp.]